MQRERVDFVQIHVLNLFRCKSEYFRNVMINYQYDYVIMYIHIVLHFRTLDPIQSSTCLFHQKLHTIRYHCSLTFYKCAIADSAMHSTLKFMSHEKKKVNPTLQNSNWILWRKKSKLYLCVLSVSLMKW